MTQYCFGLRISLEIRLEFHFDSAFLFTSLTELIMLLKTDDYSQ